MNIRSVVNTVLLIFVAASLVALAAKNLRHSPTEGDAQSAAASRADRVMAYYFHGKVRCPTCQSIEAYAHEAVTGGFAAQCGDGRIEWKVIDYEQPENEHFAKEFDLAAPSVVLVEIRDGQQKSWKNLPEVWSLVGDKPSFVKLVQQEVQTLLDRLPAKSQ